MDNRILRSLIYLFGGLIVIFTLLMMVNSIGSWLGSPSDLPGQAAEGDAKPDSAEAMAQQALATAKYAAATTPGTSIPMGRQGLSTAPVNSDGAIKVVRNSDFNGVAESPKDMMTMLNEMGGGRKKPAPIRLSDADFNKKIRNLGGEPGAEPKLRVSTMPELGRGAGQEGLTMFTAPVDYKVFKTSETWSAFANSHKCRQPEGQAGFKPFAPTLSAADFAAHSVVVLISVSELPNGIFKIVKLERSGKTIVVGYRVDPLAMSAGGDGGHDFYSAAVIPKDSSVKLSQLP